MIFIKATKKTVSNTIGKGVFSKELVLPNQLVGTYEGKFTIPDKWGNFPNDKDQVFAVQISEDTWLRPLVYGVKQWHGLEWFMNHGCADTANCYMPESGTLRSTQLILPGAELRLNYATFELYNYIDRCLCGNSECYGKNGKKMGGFLSLSENEKERLYREGVLTPYIRCYYEQTSKKEKQNIHGFTFAK